MKPFCFTVVVVFASYLFLGHALTSESETFPSTNTTRQGKIFSFFSSTNTNDDIDTCTSGANTGICVKSSRCKSRGGTTFSGGDCARGTVCCQITVNCTSRLDSRDRCAIRISGTTVKREVGLQNYSRTYRYIKPRGICQLRLDFDDFELAHPELNGDCRTEVYKIRGLTTCGFNKGQHAYFDFGESSTIDADIRIRRASSVYSIRNTFIPCNSERRAPEGCLQYFDAAEGTVRSFNYDLAASRATLNRQTNNLDYSVCIKPREGSNKIQWQSCRNQVNAFFISGGGFGVPMGNGTEQCNKDWVQIYGQGRYCGRGIRTVISTVKPFMMNVHFDEAEGFLAAIPTDPSECENLIIDDPYSGGRFVCGVDLGECTCLFEPMSTASPPTIPPDPFTFPDGENTGFCLDFEQMA